MNHDDVSAMMKGVAPVVRDYVAKAMVSVNDRFDLVERKISELPEPVTIDAKTLVATEAETLIADLRREWQSQLDAMSSESRATIAELRATVAELSGVARASFEDHATRLSDAISGVKDGAPGRDGRDADPVDMAYIERAIDERVEAKVAAIHVPKDGRDGVDGKDGDSVSVDVVEKMVSDRVSAAFATMPIPKDGQSPTPDELLPIIEPVIQRVFAEIPAPQNGKDGADGQTGKDADPVTREQIAEVVKSEIELFDDAAARYLKANPPRDGVDGKDGEPGPEGKAAEPVTKDQIIEAVLACDDVLQEAVVKHLTVNPPPAGRDGVDGAPGDPGPAGKDATTITKEQIIDAVLACEDALHEVVAKHLTDNPPAAGRDGIDGKNVDPAEIEQMICEYVAVLPPPKDGKDAEPVTKDQIVDAVLMCGEALQEAAAKHLTLNPPPAGQDGKDAAPVDYDGIQKFVLARVAEIPVPKDDKDGIGLAGAFINRSGSLVVTLSSGSVQELGPVEGKSVDPTEIKEIVRTELRSVETKTPDVNEAVFSPHLMGMIDVAHRALSEPLVVRSGEQSTQAPLTLNVGPPAPPPKPLRKTIHTRRDKNGDLVADITESET